MAEAGMRDQCSGLRAFMQSLCIEAKAWLAVVPNGYMLVGYNRSEPEPIAELPRLSASDFVALAGSCPLITYTRSCMRKSTRGCAFGAMRLDQLIC